MPNLRFEKMHACVQMCEDLHCDLGDGGDDAGNDAYEGSGVGGATMMIAMLIVVSALVKLVLVVW